MTTPAPPVTLTTWLLAQLDAEEAVALAATGNASRQRVADADALVRWHDFSVENAHHYAAQDPATTLARIAAVRAVVELAAALQADIERLAPSGLTVTAEAKILRALAQPYAGRDGWDQGWAL